MSVENENAVEVPKEVREAAIKHAFQCYLIARHSTENMLDKVTTVEELTLWRQAYVRLMDIRRTEVQELIEAYCDDYRTMDLIYLAQVFGGIGQLLWWELLASMALVTR